MFPPISFSKLLCFSYNNVFKSFPFFEALSDLLKQRKFLTNLKNSRIISAYHIEVFAKKKKV